jgi:hypothetical protein
VSLSVLPVCIIILAKTLNFDFNKRNGIIERCMCLDNCFNDSPEEEPYEAISWDLYNLQYGSPKTRSKKFHVINRMMPEILKEMTVFERSELIKLVLKQQDRRVRLGMRDFGISDISLLSLQSDEIVAGSTITDNSNALGAPAQDQEVIVRYLDESPGTLVEHIPLTDKTFHGDFVEDHDIGKFLSRPIAISTISWAEGANLNTTIQPWDLFFNTASIRKKLDNFSRLTCNLHIKVILNASPFFYGAGLVSYQPITNFNTSTIAGSLTTNGDAHICALSQQPHIWIYPQTNQGGEMVLPFLNYRTWLNIGVRADVQSFGSMTIQSPTALLNANSVAAANVTIQIYAWATDVKLCAPTSVLALQAKDEYGVVSGPASSVASVARSLSAVPMIGPYARATEMLASGIGSLAKLFGFTNVPVIEDVKPFKNVPFHAFASAEISQPIEKLSIDPKNELTVDSRVCGHNGIDELLLSNFIQRESYLLQATWAAAHTTGQVLIRANVTPDTKITEVHTVNYIQGTPMSHANSLFRYWRGDIIYRFRFICSKFHRGRVKIQWDPQSGLTAAQDSNVIHTQIVDISTDTDVEFRVPYLCNTLFARNAGRSQDANTYNTVNIVNTGAITAYNSALHNGRICLSVLTQQTSPVASADIIILVSARAAENMVFGMPQHPPREQSQFDLQSEDIESSVSSGSFNYDETKHFDLTSKGAVLDDETFTVCMGERITSLRQLLRRTTYHRSWLLTATPSATVPTHFVCNHARLPLPYGYDPNGIDSGTSTLASPAQVPFNFVYPSFITWIASCFVGHRGSINWHYNIDDSQYVNSFRTIRFSGPTITTSDYKLTATPSLASSSAYARSGIVIRDSGGQGMSLCNTRTQAGVSTQYPQFSINRMQTPNHTKLVLGSAVDESDQDHCRLEIALQPHTATNLSAPAVDFYVSCGTDFNCIFFINVPTMIYYPTPTTIP